MSLSVSLMQADSFGHSVRKRGAMRKRRADANRTQARSYRYDTNINKHYDNEVHVTCAGMERPSKAINEDGISYHLHYRPYDML